MHIELIQKYKGLHQADFIIRDELNIFGDVHLEGKFGSNDGVISLRFKGTNISMLPVSRRNFKGIDVYRPYVIMSGDDEIGYIYETTKKTSFFK
jgi:hypothetical protein